MRVIPYIASLLGLMLALPLSANENPVEPRGAHRFQEGLATITVDGKWGFIDTTGKIVVPPQFDFLTGVFDGHAAAYAEGETFLIDTRGRRTGLDVALFPHYARGALQPYSETDAAGSVKWGYRNAEGEAVTPAVFDMVSHREGLHIIGLVDEGAPYLRYLEGFVDDKGAVIVPPVMQWIGPFSEGLANVIQDCRHHFIDGQGRRAVPGDFTAALDFSEGLAAVDVGPALVQSINSTQSGEWTFIDRQGQRPIPTIFKQAWSFHEGRAVVMTAELLHGVIDKQGRYVVEPVYQRIEYTPGSGMFVVGVETPEYRLAFGLLVLDGRVIVEPRYQDIETLGEGMAAVLQETDEGPRWGFVNAAGELVVDHRFDEVRAFSQGYANVRIGERRGYIDPTGNFLWMPSR